MKIGGEKRKRRVMTRYGSGTVWLGCLEVDVFRKFVVVRYVEKGEEEGGQCQCARKNGTKNA